MSLNNRIKSTYKSGGRLQSLLGFSHILGKRIENNVKYITLPKYDPSCYANNYSQELQLLVSQYLYQYSYAKYIKNVDISIYDQGVLSLVVDFYNLLEALESTDLNSISGFMFLLGESTDHLFSEDFLQRTLNLVQQYSTEVGDAKDFTVGLRHPQFNLLARIEVQIRLLESRYTEWRYREEVLKNIYQMVAEEKSPDYVYQVIQGITYNAECLNALSKLLYWGRRYLMKISNVEERYWNHE